MSPDKKDLEAIFRDPRGYLETLKISHKAIVRVLGPLENQPGGESRVYEVVTSKGLGVIRIDFAQVLKDRLIAIVLQSYLGRFGITPEIYGLLEGDELHSMIGSRPALSGIRSPWVEKPKAPAFSAILMSRVVDGWNILQPERNGQIPKHAARWEAESILLQIGFIQDTLTSLGIQIIDPQYLISRQGQVKIIDLDHWVFIDSKDRYWAYHGLADYRFDTWVDHPKNLRHMNDFTRRVRAALKGLAVANAGSPSPPEGGEGRVRGKAAALTPTLSR